MCLKPDSAISPLAGDGELGVAEDFCKVRNFAIQPGEKKAFFLMVSSGRLRFMDSHPNDPLHGYTLETIVTRLVEEYGWDELADRVRIRCFANNPSIKSTLTFLRKTPWARRKIEAIFIELVEQDA